MPKSTFTKLPTSKKTFFIETALAVFAQQGYDQVSLDKLVGILGIAKGSIYQYFENKKDLYFYLVEYANAQKQQFVAAHLPTAEGDFFRWFKTMHQLGMAFEAHAPLVSNFLYSIAKERHTKALGDLYLIILQQNTAFFEQLIKKEQAQGNLRDDLNAHFIAFGLAQWTNGLQEYFQLQAKNDNAMPPAEVLESLIKILKEGISTKS